MCNAYNVYNKYKIWSCAHIWFYLCVDHDTCITSALAPSVLAPAAVVPAAVELAPTTVQPAGGLSTLAAATAEARAAAAAGTETDGAGSETAAKSSSTLGLVGAAAC